MASCFFNASLYKRSFSRLSCLFFKCDATPTLVAESMATGAASTNTPAAIPPPTIVPAVARLDVIPAADKPTTPRP